MKVVYLFVEGNTDKALIEALLQKYYKYSEYNNEKDMPGLLSRQISRYPKADGELESKGKSTFLYKEDTCIMIEVAGGKDKFAEKIAGRLNAASIEDSVDDELVIAMIQDRDLGVEDKIHSEIKKAFEEKGIIWKEEKINYQGEKYCFFDYILPLNSFGAVEKIILDLSNRVYEDLTSEAKLYRDSIEKKEQFAAYREKWAKPEYQPLYADKVQVGAITAVLKPDSSPAMMVKDKLITRNNLDIVLESEEIKGLISFLDKLVENRYMTNLRKDV